MCQHLDDRILEKFQEQIIQGMNLLAALQDLLYKHVLYLFR
jgi:hypothetical protein